MTDPFSISGGVVGVVSLGLTVSQGLIAYYGPWKSYDDEISGFTTRLEGLQHSLQVLHEFISPEQELDLPSDQYKKIVSLQLKSCEDACQKLEGMLDKCKSTDTSPFVRKHDWLRLKRASYPFKKETLVTLSQYVSSVQDNLNLSLQLLNGALITQQQKQIQVLASTTTRILTAVEQSNTTPPSTQTMMRQRTARCKSAIRPILEPKTLEKLCNQQTLINTSWKRGQAFQLANSPVHLVLRYCTCIKPSWCLLNLSLSAFTAHELSCPMYMDGQHTMGISARYTICNRLLGISVNVMMTLTKGAGAFSISPTIQFRPIVANDFPAFRLLKEARDNANGVNSSEILNKTRGALIQMIQKREVAPTEQLADGTTLLHGVAYILDTRFSTKSNGLLILDGIRDFVLALIDMGVPVNERTIHGDTALDILIWRISSLSAPWEGVQTVEVELLQRFLRAGGSLGSLERPIHCSDIAGYYCVTCMYQTAKTVQTLVHRNTLEDIQASQIEVAILMRSEEALRRCLSLASNPHHTDNTPTPSFQTLLTQCMGWNAGIVLLIESSLPRDSGSLAECFSVACTAREFESALLLIQYTTVIPLSYLTYAVTARNMDLLESIIPRLAAHRRELMILALRHLPRQDILALGLPTDGLLDGNAIAVYDTLALHGTKIEHFHTSDGCSVYSAILGDILTAEMLYTAGFTDLTQCGANGNSPMSDLRVPSSAWVTSVAELAQWMVSRGASLYEASLGGYPAIFDLAEHLGQWLEHWQFLCSCPEVMYSYQHKEGASPMVCLTRQRSHTDTRKIMSALLLDSPLDDCLCACSDGGCSPLLRVLRAHYSSHCEDSSVSGRKDIRDSEWSVYRIFGTDPKRSNVSATLRFITFEALRIPHTCHKLSGQSAVQPIEDEIFEIRDEHSASIRQLDDLMVEFDEKYDELGVGVPEFLGGYWHTRMDEMLQEHDIDLNEAMKLREIGVVLSDAADGLSDDGEN